MKKCDHSCRRTDIRTFRQIINVGPATEKDFRLLGFDAPTGLIGQDAWQLYERLCQMTGEFHDPCVLDVFLSVIAYMNGEPPKPWPDFTESRKQCYGEQVAKLRSSVGTCTGARGL